MKREDLYGRLLLKKEINQDWTGNEWPDVKKIPAIDCLGPQAKCQRCGASQDQQFHKIPCSCGNDCFYCLSCIKMGQVKACDYLYHLTEANAFKRPAGPILSWEGRLSDQQAEASRAIIHSIDQKETRLIWAVAGAGKTEMLFAGIAHALGQGLRVCIASPRVDVCLELEPRLKQAFYGIDQVTLYGDMKGAYRYTPLTLATTHQLLRFREAFDLLIIDEIDAFPFRGNENLNYAVNRARKKESTLIYMSATPDRQMQDQVRKKQLLASILPARYHGHPLPQPRFVWAGDWRKQVLKRPDYSPLVRLMKEKLDQGRRFLLFVPHIEWMKAFHDLCLKLFKAYKFTSVYAQDPNRQSRVMAMREGKLDFLMTTTILERGVTFKDIDVLVIGAEHRVFTESALVQISGRSGRHPDFPTGDVVFFHYGQSRAMKEAKRQIESMNDLARKRGLVS